MAFIRKRGSNYYLVHNVRQEGRIRQIHLACLGQRPRISEDVVRDVRSSHPLLRLDWKGLRERTSPGLVPRLAHNSRYLRHLLSALRSLVLDLEDLTPAVFDLTNERELSAQLFTGLKLLRSTLDVKLHEVRKVKRLSFNV